MILVLVALAFFYFLLIKDTGKTFPVLYLFLFTFFIQYIFSTYLIYNGYPDLKREMPISRENFFEYCLPALGSLFAGVFFFKKDLSGNVFGGVDSHRALRMGTLLLFISYGFDLGRLAGLGWLGSLISFTWYLKFVGAFCFLFTRSFVNYFIVMLVYVQLAATVLRGGVFIDFFIWSLFLFFFICLKFKIPLVMRLSFIFIAVPFLILIQSVKNEYREATWGGQKEGGVELLTDIASKKEEENLGQPFSKSSGVIRTVGRLSQGWHLGLTLRRVPKKQPVVNGEEMASDIGASLVPRVFFPNKKVVHTNEKFFKYTGHKLPKNTSMTIGVLGDFYVNFGWWGSFVMLFVFGALIAKFLNYFQNRYVSEDPLTIVWVPFLFSYLVRADNDFYIIFNCMLKGFLIFLFIRYLERQFWPRQQPKIQLR